MIHFDTNALIALPFLAKDGHPVIARVAAGEEAGVSAVAWYEFLIGSVDDEEVSLARAFVRGNILGIDQETAQVAASLYNQVGRRRMLKTDALIAAVAVRAHAALLTLNSDDFRPFVPFGLELAQD